MNTLMWFRQDLRLTDNQALTQACKAVTTTAGGSVRAVYFATPLQWQRHDVAAIQIDFINRQVNYLGHELAKLGIQLDVITVADFRAQENALVEYIEQYDIDAVYASVEPEWNESLRDKNIVDLLSRGTDSGLTRPCLLHLFDQHCAIAPGKVTNLSGGMYKVFTPFAKKWRSLALSLPFQPLPCPSIKLGGRIAVSFTDVPFELGNHYPQQVSSQAWAVGELAASDQLNQFIASKITLYAQHRDFPAMQFTSGISPYLAIGMLSPTQCLAAILIQFPDALVNEASRCKTWINEIIWREFYRHLLVAFPKLSRNQNFNALGDNIQWRNNLEEFDAWCQGKTGYPIVDAAMTQLNQTGWMHNRLRMVVASFLTKHLLIDWRWGERYFKQKLIDGDLAANNGGWQWSAGTGCDAQPYFRVFNPHTQSEKFDPQAQFIKQYLPQLQHFSAKAIHHGELTTVADLFAPDISHYPEMIVDHKAARLRAIEVLGALKKKA
ncbi:deoxyribodipyrimidine photo-lyase [Shewanella maritima]|uniref:deoxyribodipyrimidine photo-lyase n=1 Tax=Shewanella maritima TaxID=2520507 RepID=UPI00373600B6